MWPDSGDNGAVSADGTASMHQLQGWAHSNNMDVLICCARLCLVIREMSPSLQTLKTLESPSVRAPCRHSVAASSPHSKPSCWSSSAFTSWETTRRRWRQLACPSPSGATGLCPAHSPRLPRPPSLCPYRSHPLSQGSQQVMFWGLETESVGLWSPFSFTLCFSAPCPCEATCPGSESQMCLWTL